MSTNYYLTGDFDKLLAALPEELEGCVRILHKRPMLHIGKSSRGWLFSGRAYRLEDDPFREEWNVHSVIALVDAGGAEIINEYGDPLDIEAFMKVIWSTYRADPDLFMGPYCDYSEKHGKYYTTDGRLDDDLPVAHYYNDFS